MPLNVEIDQGSGFCFGVTRAISKAEEELNATGHLYCLGDIVHNSNEVERLKSRGLVTITHEQLERLHNVKVLLRAHGEPPSTYETARRNNIEIIYGKRGHAEVLGLEGQTRGTALVIESIDEIDKIDYTRNIYLYSQTTKSVDGFKRIVEEISRRVGPGIKFESYDTICRSVANRIPQVRHFASQHQLVLFVCGSKSSNGRILFAQCLDANAHSHLISNASEIDPAWLQGMERVGICGATSTPRWLMNQVRDAVLALSGQAGTDGR